MLLREINVFCNDCGINFRPFRCQFCADCARKRHYASYRRWKLRVGYVQSRKPYSKEQKQHAVNYSRSRRHRTLGRSCQSCGRDDSEVVWSGKLSSCSACARQMYRRGSCSNGHALYVGARGLNCREQTCPYSSKHGL